MSESAAVSFDTAYWQGNRSVVRLPELRTSRACNGPHTSFSAYLLRGRSTLPEMGCGSGCWKESFERELGHRVTGEPRHAKTAEHAAILGVNGEVARGDFVALEQASFEPLFDCGSVEHFSVRSQAQVRYARLWRPGGGEAVSRDPAVGSRTAITRR